MPWIDAIPADLPPDHPHLKEHGGNADHRHPAMADDLHTWRVTP